MYKKCVARAKFLCCLLNLTVIVVVFYGLVAIASWDREAEAVTLGWTGPTGQRRPPLVAQG